MKNKIAIIDTGINLAVNKFIVDESNSIAIALEHGKFIEDKSIQDNQGHGTMCASIITSLVENVEIVAIKIFDDLRVSKSLLMIEALRKCLDIDVDVINVSLATLDYSHYKEIHDIVTLLKQQNKIVVAALHNIAKPSIPAVLDNVIGVVGKGSNGESSNFLFNKGNIIQGYFDNTPQFALDHNGKYRLFSGNSKATAVASGTILKCMRQNDLKTFYQVSDYFHKRSKQAKFKQIPFKEYKISNSSCNDEIINKVAQFIKQVTGTEVNRKIMLNEPIMQKKIGLNYDNMIDLINKIVDYYNISMDISKITANQICSMNMLLHLIRMEGEV